MKTKNIILLSMMLLIMDFSLFAQLPPGYVYIKTPNGSNVEAIDNTSNNSPQQIQVAENSASSFLALRGWTNLVTKVENASLAYNCHSYAWYKSEGGTPDYWINSFTRAQELAYPLSSPTSTLRPANQS